MTDLATAHDVVNVRYPHILPSDVSLLLVVLSILFENSHFEVGTLELDGTEETEVVE